jgi:hypothetical protein
MSFVSRFRRKPADEVVPAMEAVLVIHQHALSYRSSDWYGYANYHVRVFLPENARRPIIIVGDMDNHPVASITERPAEIAVIVVNLLLGRPGVHPARLDDHARWLTYFPADSVPGERFGELHGFHVVPGYETPFVAPQHYNLRREEAEGLVGGALGTWQRREYTAANLERRGARVIEVRPGDL